MILNQPLVVVSRLAQYDLSGDGRGRRPFRPGRRGVRHGLAKALTYYEPDLRGPLKKEGFLSARLPRRGRAAARNTATRRPARASSSPSAEFVGDAISRRAASAALCFSGIVPLHIPHIQRDLNRPA